MDTVQNDRKTSQSVIKLQGDAIDARRAPQPPAQEGKEAANIEKVRDILFGAHMREQEKKILRMEQRTVKAITQLRAETGKRFDSLENYIKNEMAAINNRLQTEQDERIDAVTQVTKEVAHVLQTLEKRMAKLNNQVDQNAMDLRRELMDQSKTILAEVQRKYEQAATALEQSSAQLRADKVDRNALSDMFSEISMRLTDDFSIDLDFEPGDVEP
jgi:molybdopterin converting factor small subunit